MRSRVLLVDAAAAVLGLAPAPLPRNDRHREDPSDVTGTWEFVLWETNGDRSREQERTHRVEMTREKFVFLGKDGGNRGEFVMRLDTAASPPAFTWSREVDQVKLVGSYRLHKGEMTMILTLGDRMPDRPIDFSGAATFKFVLRRVKR
jgi:uncharacterized protein (TIGR03067 family)